MSRIKLNHSNLVVSARKATKKFRSASVSYTLALAKSAAAHAGAAPTKPKPH
jgi:hypothetical protein